MNGRRPLGICLCVVGAIVLTASADEYARQTARVQRQLARPDGRRSMTVISKTFPVELFVDGVFQVTLFKGQPEKTIELAPGEHILEAVQQGAVLRLPFRLTSEQSRILEIIPPIDAWPLPFPERVKVVTRQSPPSTGLWQWLAVAGIFLFVLGVRLLVSGGHMRTGTVLVLDLVGFSIISRILEEGLNATAVSQLKQQIQQFIDLGLISVGATRASTVFETTGDGAILMFDQASVAMEFARYVHHATSEHNNPKTEPIGIRLFRVGMATGAVDFQPKLISGFTISGQIIALAVRLEGKANPGGILVDVETFNNVADDQKKKFTEIEDVSVKHGEVFAAHRCVMDPDAENAVALLKKL